MGYDARVVRLGRLLEAHRGAGLAIAFSGGVDSSVLLHAAHARLAARAVGILADSPSLPRSELREARRTAAEIGARLEVLATDELAVDGYRRNQGLRCYHCRHTLFERMRAWALVHGLGAIAYGEITDDLADDRPGRRAAEELEVVAPLRAAGLSKDDVRRYARDHGLRVADKPASACLASRIPRGSEVTLERLRRVELAEETLGALGFDVLRVRDHGHLARVEVDPQELARAGSVRDRIAGMLRPLGFEDVQLSAYGAGRAGVWDSLGPAGDPR